jgi:TRAP-type C4-dicarboxylate transport system substrate-binding protein
MIRKVAITSLVLFASLVGPAATGTTKTAGADEPKVIRLSTLAPKASSWGTVFESWKRTFKKETGGQCEIDWAYSGGATGDEPGMIGGMLSGDRHGGALTATGLSQIYPSVVALQMPGLVETWPQLDALRAKVRGQFDTAFEAKGFKILGWGDVGIGHIMFKAGTKPEIRTPDHLKQYKTFSIAGDAIGAKFLEAVGISSPKQLSVPAILPSLNSGAVEVITTPAIAAEQLQWGPHLTHVIDMPVGFGIGALIVKKDFYAGLPDNCRKVFEETGKNTSAALTTTIRGVDENAWTELKRTKKVVTLTDAEKAAWQEKFKFVRGKLKDEGKIEAGTWTAVVAAAGKQ